MAMKQYFKKNKYIFLCFFINLLLGILAIGWAMLKEEGMFSLGTDYDAIVISIYNDIRKAILNGDVFWNWSFDLGTDFVGSNSFIALGSPFFWMTLPFYKVDYLYLGGWMFIIKYAVAGMTAGLYLQRFTEKKQFAVIGSILYAFSGFQSVNLMMGSFHDIVALFPLLLYGIEVLIKENRKCVFAAAVCINALVNYYFFVGEVIFLIIYFLVRFLWEDLKNIKKIPVCIAEGIIGIMMAGIVFYPSILFILNNPRSGGRIPLSAWFLTNRRDILKLFRSVLFPGEMMQQWSCVKNADWTSSSLYIPMVGMVLVFSYILKKLREKDWLKRLCVVCMIFMIMPVLSSLFTLMTDVYCRWYYMPLLIFAMVSVKVMEDISQYAVRWVTAAVFGIMVISMVIFEWWDRNRFQIIFAEKVYWVLNITALLGLALTWIITYVEKYKKVYFRILILGVSLFAIFTTLYTCKRYQDARGYEGSEYKEKLAAINEMGEFVDVHIAMHRMINVDNVIASILNISPIGSAFSNVEGSIFELWNVLGEERRVVCPEIPAGFEELMGAGYYMTSEMFMEEGWQLLGEKTLGNKTYYLYEKEDARPIGVTYDLYMLKEDFLNLPKESRAMLMQSILVIDKEDEVFVADSIAQYNDKTSYSQQQSITDFVRDNMGFQCFLDSTGKKFTLFSIPYAQGWRAYVNGEEAKIINASGLMAIEVGAGKNQIRFRYFNSDVLVGICFTVMGLLLWTGRMYIFNLRTRKATRCKSIE